MLLSLIRVRGEGIFFLYPPPLPRSLGLSFYCLLIWLLQNFRFLALTHTFLHLVFLFVNVVIQSTFFFPFIYYYFICEFLVQNMKKKKAEEKRENFVLIFPDTKSKMRTVEGNKEKEKMTEKIKYIKAEEKKDFEKGVLLIIFFHLKLHIFVPNRFLANCFLNTQMRKCHSGNCLCNEGVLAKSPFFFRRFFLSTFYNNVKFLFL